MLISAVLPIMSLYKLPHGQYAHSGHVINLPHDVATFANYLPQLLSELDVIVIRRKGAANSHRDFRFRRAAVLHALQWLVANKYYHNVCINSDTLAMLPEDGNLSGLHSVTFNSITGSPCTVDEDETALTFQAPLSPALLTEQETETLCAGVTISPPTSSSSTYTVLASQWFNSYQRVQA